jgi:hypothetical protein
MMGLAGWIRRFASHKHIDYCGLFQINTLCIRSAPGAGAGGHIHCIQCSCVYIFSARCGIGQMIRGETGRAADL